MSYDTVNDSWKYYQPLKVEGCEKFENEAMLCVEKTQQAQEESKKCEEAAKRGDLPTAQKHADKLKKLAEEIKEHRANVEKWTAEVETSLENKRKEKQNE